MFLLYSITEGSAAPQIPTTGGYLAEIRTRDRVTEWQVCYQLSYHTSDSATPPPLSYYTSIANIAQWLGLSFTFRWSWVRFPNSATFNDISKNRYRNGCATLYNVQCGLADLAFSC